MHIARTVRINFKAFRLQCCRFSYRANTHVNLYSQPSNVSWSSLTSIKTKRIGCIEKGIGKIIPIISHSTILSDQTRFVKGVLHAFVIICFIRRTCAEYLFAASQDG